MTTKIKEALKTRWGNQLGIKDEMVFEGVAASVQTLITSDEQLTQFVEGAKDMLTNYQRAADKVRTELNAKIKGLEGEKADLEAKLNGKQPDPKPQDPPKDTEPQPQDMAKIIADAVAAAIKPISDELAGFKAEQSAKTALVSAESTFKSNDYVKKYADEATDAWERATEMYEATGKKWTAEELGERAMGYFNKAVAKKGVDTTKPFESDGGGGKDELDTDEIKRIYQKSGRLPSEN